MQDLSLGTLIQFIAGVSLWTAYSFYLGDPIIIASNIAALAILLLALALYVRFARRRRP